MSPVQDPCAICGWDRPGEVRVGLIRWAEPAGRLSVTAAPRCRDRAACRARCLANGDPWDVIDAEDREEARDA